MKSTGAIQVAAVLLLVASAASCEVAKEYSNRVFKPTISQKGNDSTVAALRFMQFDSRNASDSIDIKDFANNEIKEDNTPELLKDTSKAEVAIAENKMIQKQQPINASKRGETRSKKVRQ